ncbi:MAG TPA: protein kinase [Streptosporangiaceae bacterium]|nr:protein kinase [Streptosporangiaceae bacterium]
MVDELRASDPVQLGKYRLIGRLGDGGMGEVYLARSPGGRKVAVKVIKTELAQDADFRARFSREVEAAKRVGGIFTAPVVDADPGCERPWLATAYVEGKSLAETVRDQGPLDLESVLRLAAGLTEGLAAIHTAGVIHRDLKPSNVLLAADGPRIIDFGISRPMDADELTSTGNILGSPGFMSPEQAEGLPIGPPTDIFSLGAVLTFAATGNGPFGSARDTVLLYRVIYTAPSLGKVPELIRPLIERCLAMDPAARPTPEQIMADLDGQTPAVRYPDDSPDTVLPPLAQSGTGHPQSSPVTVQAKRPDAAAPPTGRQPATNPRVFGGPVMIDSQGYPVHINQPEPAQTPEHPAPGQPGPGQPAAMPAAYPVAAAPGPPPPPLPLLVPASPPPARRKGRGWLAYSAVAAVLIVAAAVVVGVHIAGQGSALPERVPSTTSSASSPAGHSPAGHSPAGHSPGEHSATGQRPAAVVRAYYKALNNGNFAKAWALGGKNLGQNFATFVAGFAQDANIGIMSLTTAGNTVTAKTQAFEFDGETKVLNLTYTVVNGVITAVSDHTP